jgi:hypothetical protein
VRQLIRVTLSVAFVSATTLGGYADQQSALQRYLARAEEPSVEYRALRHLEATNAQFHKSAWMDAWTSYDRVRGFQYQIVAEGGNSYIRNRVLRAALEGEQEMWARQEPDRASITLENYTFRDRNLIVNGLAALAITPRRRDVLLVDGTIYVQPDNGELRRVEGRLSKVPSFWTRKVEISREYERIAGVRVPVSFDSVAHVLIAGRSAFRMTYEYQTINGHHVGDPRRTTE